MKVKRLEQHGAIQLLFYLEKKGEANIREMIKNNKGKISQTAIYRATNILKELELVDEERLTNPPRRIISLTDKGKQAIKKLRDLVMQVLSGSSVKLLPKKKNPLQDFL